jgi:hypothetical protein
MVPILQYKAFWEYLITIVSGIDRARLAFDLEDFSEIIKEIEADEVVLLAVMPSSDTEATSFDDYEEIDTVYVYLLKKCNPADLTHDEVIAEMAAIQLIMHNVKHKLIELSADHEHQCSNALIGLMKDLMVGTMRTDPEYNLMGCNGYALNFKLKTAGV